MKTLFLDCFSGISGDMTIAALLDLGASMKKLEGELSRLKLREEYKLVAGRGSQQAIAGRTFRVVTRETSRKKARQQHRAHSHGARKAPSGGGFLSVEGLVKAEGSARLLEADHQHGRTYRDIRLLLQDSRLSTGVQDRSLSIFHRLAVAEGKIHGMDPEKVHFHEVGALDSIVDIVGVCVLLDDLGIEQVIASTPCDGHGFVKCAHGTFPVPAPATLELLKGVTYRQIDIPGELITPTGAAILKEFARVFGPMPPMEIQSIGYGLGTKVFPGHPNALRAILGTTHEVSAGEGASREALEVDVIETNLDDVTPEILADSMDVLLQSGALDVFLTPIVMKKGRAATKLTMLSEPRQTSNLASKLMDLTGTFGVRMYRSRRLCLDREIKKAQTPWGTIGLKIGRKHGEIISVKPEYESCRKLAREHGVPVRQIMAAADVERVRLLKRGVRR
jgi:pyridinium-3,5-bisthiocarboxylic acid mononucleotide nickel chelatase